MAPTTKKEWLEDIVGNRRTLAEAKEGRFHRMRELHDAGSVSEGDVEAASYAWLEAEIDYAQAQIALLDAS